MSFSSTPLDKAQILKIYFKKLQRVCVCERAILADK